MGILDHIDTTPRIGDYDKHGVKPVSSPAPIQELPKKNQVVKPKVRPCKKSDVDEYIPSSDVMDFLYDKQGRPVETSLPEEDVNFPAGGGSFQEVFKNILKGRK